MTPGGGPRPRRRPGPPEGEPAVFAADEQSSHPVDVPRFAAIAEGVLRAEGVRGACELALYFIDEETIADLNQRFLDGDGPTDVLAFPIDDELVEGGRAPDAGSSGPDRPPMELSEIPLLLGDVLICPAVAHRNVLSRTGGDHPTAEQAGTYDDELALLTVHGVLHVLGMDHAEPAEAAAMQARERELLVALHRPPGEPA
jgi:probable rRNA maturation factor